MRNNVELAAEIADLWLKDKCSAWATVYRQEPNGDLVYVDAAQEMFNDLYDDIYFTKVGSFSNDKSEF